MPAVPDALTLVPADDAPESTTAEDGAVLRAGPEAGVTTRCSADGTAGLEEPWTVPAEGTTLSWPSAVAAGAVDCRGTIVRGAGSTVCTTPVVTFCRLRTRSPTGSLALIAFGAD